MDQTRQIRREREVKTITNDLKQKLGEICEKYKIIICPKEEPLYDHLKEGANRKEIPPNMINNIPDCGEKDAFGVSVSLVFQVCPDQKEPRLKNVFLSHELWVHRIHLSVIFQALFQ